MSLVLTEIPGLLFGFEGLGTPSAAAADLVEASRPSSRPGRDPGRPACPWWNGSADRDAVAPYGCFARTASTRQNVLIPGYSIDAVTFHFSCFESAADRSERCRDAAIPPPPRRRLHAGAAALPFRA